MAYIGKLPVVGNFQVCDAISVVNGQAAYTMQVASTDISPQSANHMLVSLNGVLQKPGSSYTVSGATITFASNLVTNDVIDFIQVLGDVLNTGTPSDGAVLTAGLAANAVTGAKLNTDVISAQTALAAEPADTDEFLVSDAGVLKRIDYSLIKGSSTHTLLSTTTVSSAVANVDISSNINSTYKKYMIDLIGMHIATDDQNFRMQIFDGGSVHTGSDYNFYGIDGNETGTGIAGYKEEGTNKFVIGLSLGSVDVENFNSRIFLNNPSETTFHKIMQFESFYHDSAEKSSYNAGVMHMARANAITGVRFNTSSGNINGGVIKLYGIT